MMNKEKELHSNIRVLIIDDEQPARDLIKHFLGSHSEIEIIGEAENGFSAIKMIKELNPQLIFLDIQMPKLTGFEMLELIENPPVIIFSTAYEQYALRAFEQSAADYLLKPYSQDRFNMALEKALNKIKAGNDDRQIIQELNKATEGHEEKLSRIAIKKLQQIYVIPVSKILYIEADGDYTKIHTPEESFLKERTMKYFEQNLPDKQFIRIHRSYIVNVDYVTKIELYKKENYHVYLKNGVLLKASNTGYKLLKQIVSL